MSKGKSAVRRSLPVGVLALACAFLLQAAPAESATVTLFPEADAWVSSDAATTNHGSDTTLQFGAFGSAGDSRSYLRFQGTIPPGAVVTRTALRIYFDSAPPIPYEVRLATTNPNWNESGITWNDKPANTGPVATVFSGTAGWNNISVPLLTPGSTITYILTRGGELTNIQSRENSNKPQLLVEYAMPETTPTSACSAIGCVKSTPWVTTMSWKTVVADFNGDGRDDYLVGRHNGADDQIWLQEPDGSFQPYTLPIPGGAQAGHFPAADRHGCTAGDVNGDNRTDLYCMTGGDGGETTGKSNELWIQQPDGTFAPNQAAAWGVADPTGRGRRPLLFNFDRIGSRDDLYITNFGPRADGQRSDNILYLNNNPTNTGPFVEKPDVAGDAPGRERRGYGCVAEGNWDRDLFRDFVVCGTQLHLFHNDADNPAQPFGGMHTEQRDFLLGAPVDYPEDATLSDVNGDGWDDLVVITKATLQIRLNRGPGNPNPRFPVSFSAPVVDANSVSVGDLTGDGFPDVYVVGGVVNGPDGPHNAPDKLFTGPDWAPLDVPQADNGTGDDSEFINILGRKDLIVTNGRDYARGPVQFITFEPSTPQCSDGSDNDGDGKIDFGTGSSNDTGCLSASDNSERNTDANPQCSDEIDNDGDGKIDYGTGASNDPGCLHAVDNTENTDSNPQCSNQLNDDSDTTADYGTGPSNDPGCLSAGDNSENTDANPQCSDEIDNDGDGKIDFGIGPSNDFDCLSPLDSSESAHPNPGPLPPPPGPPPPAGTSKLAKLPKAAEVVQLPSSRRCTGRRGIRIRVRSAGAVTFTSAVVFVNSKRVKTIKQSGLRAPIQLRGLPKRKLTIKVVVKTADGRAVSRSRKYRACPKRG